MICFRTFCIFFLTIVVYLSTPVVHAQKKTPDIFTFMKQYVAFSSKDLAAIKQGEVVSKSIDTEVDHEIAAFSAVRLNLSPEQYLSRLYEDSLLIEMATMQLQGRMEIPPGEKELQAIELDAGDLRAARKGEPGDSAIRLSAKTMARIKREIDWKRSDYPAKVNRLFRQMLVDYVHEYLEKGNAAMAVYHDKRIPIHLADGIQELLEKSSLLQVYHPEFLRYLATYPTMSLGGIEDFIYWAKEDIGTKRQIISLNHVNIYRPVDIKGLKAIIASKQLYASHYFESSLCLSAIALLPENDQTGFYLLHLHRVHVDVLREKLAGFIRGEIEEGMIQLIHKKMMVVKDRTHALR